MRSQRPNYLAFIIALLLIAAVGELLANLFLTYVADDQTFLRFASFSQLQARQADKDLVPRQRPHRFLGYDLTPGFRSGKNQHNSLGFRGEEFPAAKPPGEFRIVSVGGSTTYGSGIEDDEQTYPAQLQHALRERGLSQVRVINAGVPGYSSLEVLLLTSLRIVDLHPDLILYYEGPTDVHPRLVWPPDAYTGDNQACKRPNIDRLYDVPLLERSTLMRMILVHTGRATPQSALARTWDLNGYRDDKVNACLATEFDRQWRAKTYPEGLFSQTPVMDIFKVNTPRYFERNLRELAAVASAAHAKTAFVTFAFSPLFTQDAIAGSAEYAFAYGQDNDVIRALGPAVGAVVIDAAARMGTDKELFQDGRHPTPAGAARLAAIIADEIIKSGDIAAR